MTSALDSATTGYICCSQIGGGFLGIANYGNVAANWPLAMIGNGALMSLLLSDSNQVAGRFLDQQVQWRRYLVVFLGRRLRRWAPPTIPCPQTIHGLLMGQAAKTIAFMSMVGAIIAECIASGGNIAAHSIVSERKRPSSGVESQ
jgi:hypothetical protein